MKPQCTCGTNDPTACLRCAHRVLHTCVENTDDELQALRRENERLTNLVWEEMDEGKVRQTHTTKSLAEARGCAEQLREEVKQLFLRNPRLPADYEKLCKILVFPWDPCVTCGGDATDGYTLSYGPLCIKCSGDLYDKLSNVLARFL